MNQSKYEYRKSTGGYSVDKLEFGSWHFVCKFSKKKQAIEYIESKKPIEPEQLNIFD